MVKKGENNSIFEENNCLGSVQNCSRNFKHVLKFLGGLNALIDKDKNYLKRDRNIWRADLKRFEWKDLKNLEWSCKDSLSASASLASVNSTLTSVRDMISWRIVIFSLFRSITSCLSLDRSPISEALFFMRASCTANNLKRSS